MKLHATMLAGLVSSLALSACATQIPASSKTRELIAPERSAVGLRDPRPQTVLQIGSKRAAALSRDVSVNMSGVSLITLFNAATPELNVVPMDGGVDLRRSVSVQIKDGTLGDMLRQLTVDSNHAFEVRGNNIEVSSSMTKTWNLAAFSAARKSAGGVGSDQTQQQGQGQGQGDTGGTSTSGVAGGSGVTSTGGSNNTGESSRGVQTKLSNNEDEWSALVNSARSLLGIAPAETGSGSSGGSGSDIGFGNDPAATAAGVSEDGRSSLVAIRSLGIIRATGSPRRVAQLDRWLSTLADSSTKQVHLDVKTMEVTLRDSRARGINWQALVSGSIDNFDLSGLVGFNGPVDTTQFNSTPGGITGSGTVTEDGSQQFQAVLQFLSQYGEVSLINEPNVTVTNGRTANITTGDEFSYIATVQQTVVEGGTTIATPSIARILVGVKLAVTPRVLDDNRILVNVVPVITSLQGFDQFNIGGSQFSNPNIALQSLATQVITRPGVPIHIGGLISSRLQSTLNTIPVKQSFLDSPLKWLFSSDQNSMERRELVIMITPSMVET